MHTVGPKKLWGPLSGVRREAVARVPLGKPSMKPLTVCDAIPVDLGHRAPARSPRTFQHRGRLAVCQRENDLEGGQNPRTEHGPWEDVTCL